VPPTHPLRVIKQFADRALAERIERLNAFRQLAITCNRVLVLASDRDLLELLAFAV
jgi:hypothetical protein